jgi:predicted enzyme related to lactoylglutathione lyase
VIISVSRLDRALAFYEGLLGLWRRAAPPGFAVLLLGSGASAVELMLHERPTHPSMAGVALSVRVDDVNTMAEEAQRIGCVVIDQPTDQPWGERLAVLTDPDGHVICLSTPI